MTIPQPHNFKIVRGEVGESVGLSGAEDESFIVISVTDPGQHSSAAAALSLPAALELYEYLGEAIKYAAGERS